MATVHTGYVENDQLGFYLFLAFAIHLMIILGVGFAALPEHSFTPQLEVTLARYKSSEAPEDSRYIAQVNQEGSGTEAEQMEITTRRIAEFSDTRIRQTSAAPKLTQPQPQTRDQMLLTTVNDALESLFSEPREKEPDPMLAEGIDPEIVKISSSIASLEARLDEQQQALAERPRVRRLTSLSARRAVDAAYLHNWRSKVEEIGNRHYPLASSRYGIYGDLRLLVAIRYDGTIDSIEILASSGHAVLDEAAIRIVRMAAPYEPFPADLRSSTDMLEIIRTWKFRQNRLSSVQG